jgi:hypothetical protein
MAGEIQLNSTTMATESSGTITLSNVDSATNRTNLGLGSMATQASNSVDIDGGVIDGTTIGTTSAAAGTFTTFTSTGIDDNASSTALTIDTSGNATLSSGNLVIGSAGKGIDFSGAQTAVGATDAEVLSGYERGDFIPGVAFGGGSTGILYSSSVTQATYVKMGDLVFINGFIVLTNKGSSTGDATITGLPFNVRNNNDAYSMLSIKVVNTSFADVPHASAVIGTATFSLRETSNAGVQTTLTNANFTNTSQIMFSGHYPIHS